MNYCMDGSQRRMQQIELAVDGAERSGDQLHRRHRDHQRHHPGQRQQSANRHRSIRADIRRGEFPDQRYRRSEIIGEQAVRQWRDPADKGMAAAQTALLRARPGAKKVVIFADGVPTTQNTFSTRVANDAVTTALAMKSAGTLIYSIGIFEGANPEQQSFGNRRTTKPTSSCTPCPATIRTPPRTTKPIGVRAATSATTRPPTALTT